MNYYAYDRAKTPEEFAEMIMKKLGRTPEVEEEDELSNEHRF
jgi:hypothetical protein